MAINHTKMHYVIGISALVLSGFAISRPTTVHDAAVHEIQKPSKFDWASLGQDKTIALGETLKNVAPGKVTIYCSSPSCHDLQLDLDDAFQLAGWRDDFQGLPVESEEEKGISVGPPGPDAENLAAALAKATGIDAKIVPIGSIDGVGIIIGKVPR